MAPQKRPPLPAEIKFQIVDGAAFVRLKEAAKLAGIHPVVLEMAAELLKRVNGSGASFALVTPDLQKNGLGIAAAFKSGLKRYAAAMEPTRKLKVKAYRDGNRLVFWYAS